jgi:hypothetical protein
MSNEIQHIKNPTILPEQVAVHFPNATTEQQAYLSAVYAGVKDRPNFFEWVESYLLSDLLIDAINWKKWLDQYGKSLEEHKATYRKNMPIEERKLYEDRLKSYQRIYNEVDAKRSEKLKELRVITQTNLNRESPKKVEVTQYKVSPGDVANLIHSAKEYVDTHAERIKDD